MSYDRQLLSCEKMSKGFRKERSGLPHEHIDRYRASEWIGGGSFGQVRLL